MPVASSGVVVHGKLFTGSLPEETSMSSQSSIPEPEVTVVAVSVGVEARWSWRIVARNGVRLLESSGTFSGVGDALEDGRRHVRAAVGAGSPDAPRPTVGTALNGQA
jgi:hypothetical protein